MRDYDDNIYSFIYLSALLIFSGLLYFLLPAFQSFILVLIVALAVVVLFSFLRFILEPSIDSIRQSRLAARRLDKEIKKYSPDKSKPASYYINRIEKESSQRYKKQIDKGKCQKCGGSLVLRISKYGKYKGQQFYGCSNFPKCRNIIPAKNSANKNRAVKKDASPPVCQRCGSKMVIREAQKGYYKGRKFYGCTNYPECKNIVNIK